MDMLSGVQQGVQAMQQTSIQFAVAAKVINSTADLQKDALTQLLGSMGIGNSVDMAA